MRSHDLTHHLTDGDLKALRKLLLENAIEVEAISLSLHKKYLYKQGVRMDILKKHKNRFKDLLTLVVKHLDISKLDKSADIFQKYSHTFAENMYLDGFAIEEVIDGVNFLKQAVRQKIIKAGLLDTLSVHQFCEFDEVVETLLDIVSSQVSFYFHERFQRAEEHQYKLAAIIDSSSDAIISKNSKGIITSWNQAAEVLFGYSAEEIVGKSILNLIPKELHQEEREIIRSVQVGVPIQHYKTVRVKKNGQKIVVLLSISPIKNGIGRIIGVSSIMHDITEQILIEERIRESEEKFTKAFASNPAAIVITTLEEGLFRDANPTWEKLMGYKKEDVVGLSARKLPIWPTQEDSQHFVSELKRRGIIRGWEQKFIKKSGESYVAQLSAQIMTLNGEKVIISTLVDVTERKKLERLKDEFMGVASHELKTPVTSLKAYTQFLQLTFSRQGDKKSVELLSKMDVQINKLSKLIEDLLDVTRIEAGKIRFRLEYFDINSLVKEVIEEVQRTTDHAIEVDLAENKVIYGDRDRTGQVIINLLTNAIKYSPRKDKVVVYSEINADQVILNVRDFGVGIPKEKQTKVFERFYRVEGEKEQTYPGLGLGLYISSEIIKRQGGEIWLTSRENKGSTFSFSLPTVRKDKYVTMTVLPNKKIYE